jgi:hypothetical protein
LYYLDFEVFNFHGLAPEGLGPPVQRLHVLVIQVDRLVTVRDHQLQILEKIKQEVNLMMLPKTQNFFYEQLGQRNTYKLEKVLSSGIR